MCRPVSRRLALLVGLLAALVSAASACGGDEQRASEPRPLPEEQQALGSSEYHSEEFEPALSFEVGEGWSAAPPEAPEHLHIRWKDTGG